MLNTINETRKYTFIAIIKLNKLLRECTYNIDVIVNNF